MPGVDEYYVLAEPRTSTRRLLTSATGGITMAAGVFEIRRSVAVAVVVSVLIVGGVVGGTLSLWAKHDSAGLTPPP
jgi:hypothetical protein